MDDDDRAEFSREAGGEETRVRVVVEDVEDVEDVDVETWPWTPPPPPTMMNTARTTRDEVDPLVPTRPRVSASPIVRPRVAFAD